LLVAILPSVRLGLAAVAVILPAVVGSGSKFGLPTGPPAGQPCVSHLYQPEVLFSFICNVDESSTHLANVCSAIERRSLGMLK
jgi:hypothetical protein